MQSQTAYTSGLAELGPVLLKLDTVTGGAMAREHELAKQLLRIRCGLRFANLA